MAELLYNSKKMKKAKEEIATVVGEGNPVKELHHPCLCYLDAVVRETLRLHPVLPLSMPHYPSSTCTIVDYKIPEGTKVFINVWAIHRDLTLWEHTSKFKSERFLSEAGIVDYSGNTSRYLPFRADRRIYTNITGALCGLGYVSGVRNKSPIWT